MANTGYTFGSWTAATKSGGGDWTALDIADDGNAGSTAIDLNGKASCDIGITLVEDNTGAINGLVTVAMLRDVDDSNFEDIPGLASAQVGAPYKLSITPVQNDSVFTSISISPAQFGRYVKVWLVNEGGQTLTTTVKYRTSDIPAAS
jgi:hypothetical protein